MQRRPETELMNDPVQAGAYAEADFESAHQSFIDLFVEKFPQLDITGEVLDLGCGPGDVTRRFARAFPNALLHALKVPTPCCSRPPDSISNPDWTVESA